PQLQQAIKLLALSNLEIETFVGDALDNNPLLEMGETSRENEDGDAATEAGGRTCEGGGRRRARPPVSARPAGLSAARRGA
ncbi:MAG: hypothetical protein ACU0DT_13455, partial [Albimonas sp.]